jgi:hypothetical protein
MSDKVVPPRRAAARVSEWRSVLSAGVSFAPPVEAVEGVAGSEIRLIVEEPEPGQVVYVLVDARSGKVLSRQSREEVLRTARSAKYRAGRFYDTKA